ncbi:putative D-lactate dehydrogenase [Octadecabacter antarcticus 307]|uniref:Putative D-lactate dehydrogenase n=1 Tax=Octadecabacter antarcticus 307 TaxID=391626 RepID=M9R9Z8_9RHOB|nr:FAD-binding oxidoreductase [Octadecabacter antarcticus]AGI68638.1 putative D-lactate dehydrogenase [Octadecabacter antarcticus 307]
MTPAQTSSDVVAALRNGFATDLYITEPDLLRSYANDETGTYFGLPLAIARPRSATELSHVLVRCHELDVNVVPQGGLTGLVGGAISSFEAPELVILLDRMNAIRSIDKVGFSMVLEAGCVLETAKLAADEQDCQLPITFGSQGTCSIGGNVSTNAGGYNVLRYGMTRDLVLGLEVVLPDGRIWNGLKTLRKDNRGYDLKQIFIGAEGTLGIITAVALKLFPKPTQVETALIGCASVEDAMAFYAKARRNCTDLLSAFEIILRPGMELAFATKSDLKDPLENPCPVYILMELAAGNGISLRGVLESCLEDAGDLILDGVIAMSKAQAMGLWAYRETMVAGQSAGGAYYRTDVSVPIKSIPAFLDDALSSLANLLPNGRPITYGHVGDGNIHLNVIPPTDWSMEQRKALFVQAEYLIFAAVDRFGGSISAEHGIGRSKKSAFLQRIDPITLDLFKQIKRIFDPDERLSKGRIFDL